MFTPWPTNEEIHQLKLVPHEQFEAQARNRLDVVALHLVEVPTLIGRFAIGASAFGIKAVFPPGYDEHDALGSLHRFPLAWSSWGTQRALEAGLELMGYLLGEVRDPESPVDYSYLTQFQRDVFEAVREIPWGARITHTDLAERAGHPGKPLAVGGVLRKNPAPIFIPCHRVVPVSGTIGSWCGPIEIKAWLLAHETLGCA